MYIHISTYKQGVTKPLVKKCLQDLVKVLLDCVPALNAGKREALATVDTGAWKCIHYAPEVSQPATGALGIELCAQGVSVTKVFKENY